MAENMTGLQSLFFSMSTKKEASCRPYVFYLAMLPLIHPEDLWQIPDIQMHHYWLVPLVLHVMWHLASLSQVFGWCSHAFAGLQVACRYIPSASCVANVQGWRGLSATHTAAAVDQPDLQA